MAEDCTVLYQSTLQTEPKVVKISCAIYYIMSHNHIVVRAWETASIIVTLFL